MPERTPTPTIASIPEGEVLFEGTPLACANKVLREKKVCTGEARQLRSLEATRRVLLQVEAARAVSWLWPRAISPRSANPAVEGATAGPRLFLPC